MNTPAKILIADDNQQIHDILKHLLAPRGEKETAPLLLHAFDGCTALEILAANPDCDVIVLDLKMPVMDGFAFLEQIRDNPRFQAIPVCVFSVSKEDSTRALQLGARDFIRKPGDYDEVKLRVLNLIESKRRAEASERAKITFLTTVGHELRTPLNGLSGLAQLMELTRISDEQSEYLEGILLSAQKMISLVDDAISFLESENHLHLLPQIPFSLREAVRKSVDTVLSEAEKSGVTLECDIAPELPDILAGREEKLQQIFHHLLGNAVKFSPSGKVTLRIAPGEWDGGSVQLLCSVTDNGIGISPDEQARIFEPFYQLDGSSTRRFGGMGIGLSIASRLIQMMGGVLKVESVLGGGSTFSFAVVCTVGTGEI